MKKNNLVVYTNSKVDDLGLGDYLRLISFLPNLSFKKIIWISNNEIFSLLNLCENVDEIIDIHSPKKREILESADLIINLFEENSDYKNTFYFKKILNRNENMKKNTFDLFEKLSNNLNLKKYELFHNKNNEVGNKYDVFFNWIVPDKWKIKSYPMAKWKILEDRLKEKQEFKNIVWQHENDSLEIYINKIKLSKLIVSIVGLGCHLAMLFNKPMILLSGPNNFSEAKKYKNLKVILPDNPCEWRPCNLPNGVNNCGCMGNVNVDKIYKEIINFI